MNEIKSDLIIPESWINKFDLIVKDCSGILDKKGLGSIGDSLKVMNGIKQLKAFFKQPDVKKLVEDAQDNDAGFLTDRSPTIIARHNAKVKASGKGYKLRPYTYEEIYTALLPRALEGYRMHGNEINIISFKGMPVVAGKHRRINEMTDTFQENIGTPAIKDGYAFIKCRARWTIDGNRQEIGYAADDPCHIKVAFGKWDSIDKVLGLARSKFYKTILIRISGKFIPDEPEGNFVQGTAEEVPESPKQTPPPTTPAPKKKAELSKEKAEDEPKNEAEKTSFQFCKNVKDLMDLINDGAIAETLSKVYSMPTNKLSGANVADIISKNNGDGAAFAIKIINKAVEDDER